LTVISLGRNRRSISPATVVTDGTSYRAATKRPYPMTPIELFSKMGECLRAINATNDPTERETLIDLQRLWIALADKTNFMQNGNISSDETVEDSRIHAQVTMALKTGRAVRTSLRLSSTIGSSIRHRANPQSASATSWNCPGDHRKARS